MTLYKEATGIYLSH